jgi:ribose-phosphate pyrophosphokinase
MPEEKVDAKVLMVDDLCSRGGTFITAAKVLRPVFSHVYLVVAHLENTVHAGPLLDEIDGIFASDSIYTGPGDPKIHITKI